MKMYCRMSKMYDMTGRADYLTSPDRQEHILCKSEVIDWTPYEEYERQHTKSNAPNNMGREIIIALPKEWQDLPPEELKKHASKIAKIATGKETDCMWAVHFNKSKTNLHLHVLFSERSKEKEASVYKRDVYLRPDGKVARTKAERARDENGNILPPVYRKGESKGGFTPKNEKYKLRSYSRSVKKEVAAYYKEQGVVIDEPNVLHEHHEGKQYGKRNERIYKINQELKRDNRKLNQARKFIRAAGKNRELLNFKIISMSEFLNRLTDVEKRDLGFENVDEVKKTYGQYKKNTYQILKKHRFTVDSINKLVKKWNDEGVEEAEKIMNKTKEKNNEIKKTEKREISGRKKNVDHSNQKPKESVIKQLGHNKEKVVQREKQKQRNVKRETERA